MVRLLFDGRGRRRAPRKRSTLALRGEHSKLRRSSEGLDPRARAALVLDVNAEATLFSIAAPMDREDVGLGAS
jgi:hypothetical protein